MTTNDTPKKRKGPGRPAKYEEEVQLLRELVAQQRELIEMLTTQVQKQGVQLGQAKRWGQEHQRRILTQVGNAAVILNGMLPEASGNGSGR